MSNNQFIIRDYLIEIDNNLKNISTLNVDDPTLKVLNTYDEIINNLNTKIKKLEIQEASHLSVYMMADILLDGVCLIDTECKIVSINSTYSKLTGLNEKDVIGQSTEDLLKKKLIDVSVAPKVLKERHKVSALSSNKQGDKTFLITGYPLFDEKGNLKGALSLLRDMTELTHLRRELEQTSEENERYQREINNIRNNQLGDSSIIGSSHHILKLKDLIQFVSKTDATVLITGDTGTGKELVAREIHNKSPRYNQPYITVNCAALPENLIESELFGYEKGAFTGAQNNGKIGMFESANNGTIFLDEITELPLPLQSKLLRVLQEREIMRLGGTKSIKLDIRIIAAANQDFKKLIQEGKFRSDLYYRLHVIPINILPLCDRKDDISILAWYFLDKFNKKYSRIKSLDREALYLLENYNWPGNVRELENVVERLVIMSSQENICSEDIKEILDISTPLPKIFPVMGSVNLNDAVNAYEKEIIADALKRYGSTYKAANALGISQPTVFRKAQNYGLLKDEPN